MVTVNNARIEPVVNLKSGHILFYEVLAGADQASAAKILAAIETDEQALKFDLDMLATAKNLSDATGCRLSVNLHPSSMTGFTEHLLKSRFDLSLLVFEITEISAIDVGLAKALTSAVRSHGGMIAMDDVGDGFATLELALLIRPDIIKICGSKLIDVGFLSLVVAVARVIDARVVAEHIDAKEKAVACIGHGIVFGQGYLFEGFLASKIAGSLRGICVDASQNTDRAFAC